MLDVQRPGSLTRGSPRQSRARDVRAVSASPSKASKARDTPISPTSRLGKLASQANSIAVQAHLDVIEEGQSETESAGRLAPLKLTSQSPAGATIATTADVHKDTAAVCPAPEELPSTLPDDTDGPALPRNAALQLTVQQLQAAQETEAPVPETLLNLPYNSSGPESAGADSDAPSAEPLPVISIPNRESKADSSEAAGRTMPTIGPALPSLPGWATDTNHICLEQPGTRGSQPAENRHTDPALVPQQAPAATVFALPSTVISAPDADPSASIAEPAAVLEAEVAMPVDIVSIKGKEQPATDTVPLVSTSDQLAESALPAPQQPEPEHTSKASSMATEEANIAQSLPNEVVEATLNTDDAPAIIGTAPEAIAQKPGIQTDNA